MQIAKFKHSKNTEFTICSFKVCAIFMYKKNVMAPNANRSMGGRGRVTVLSETSFVHFTWPLHCVSLWHFLYFKSGLGHITFDIFNV
jgi:hypothetical protein